MGSSYRDLIARQKGITLVRDVYNVSSRFPRSEVFGLTAQIRRAATSVPSNIAEGQGRKSNGEFRHFLYVALGSLMEVETQLTISAALDFAKQDDIDALLAHTNELGRIINGLINSTKHESATAAS